MGPTLDVDVNPTFQGAGRAADRTRIPLPAILLAVFCLFWLGLGSIRAFLIPITGARRVTRNLWSPHLSLPKVYRCIAGIWESLADLTLNEHQGNGMERGDPQ
jgi:hypothetical protein